MTEPGSLAEEAGRLLDAVHAWIEGADHDGRRGALAALAGHAAGLGGHAAGLAGALGTDGPECRLCPLCRTLNLLRHAQPETFEHLAEAAAAMAAAARSLVEPGLVRPRRRPGVERIDVR